MRRRLIWRPAELVAATAETPSARTLRLRVPDWPGHLAGQHVDVRLTAEDGYTAQRSYSLAAPADGDMIELTVESVPDGEVSPYLTEVMEVGDQVEIRGPVGGWFVWRTESKPPVLLVGGGSGIVPLMAMIRARRQAGSRVPFRLVYSLRAPDRRYYADELRSPDPGLDVSYLYTRSAPPAARPAPPAASCWTTWPRAAGRPRSSPTATCAGRPGSWRRRPTCCSRSATPPSASEPNDSVPPEADLTSSPS
ncbi:FAD-binding oxidoreductase [Nonomuraea salmonea]|uniref:FAD-binding oxidoreductase n=1 Tax=Nonomuraea salmonea TaxID=46181 RepID=UPI002FECB77F